MTEASLPLNLEGLKILVVEDSPDILLMISRFLRAEGAKVDVAEDGMQALDRTSENRYDIVLMDLKMPKLDGFTAVAAMRDRGIKVPIIALTAHSVTEIRDKCIMSGFNERLCKPIDRQTLVTEVASFAGMAKVGVH